MRNRLGFRVGELIGTWLDRRPNARLPRALGRICAALISPFQLVGRMWGNHLQAAGPDGQHGVGPIITFIGMLLTQAAAFFAYLQSHPIPSTILISSYVLFSLMPVFGIMAILRSSRADTVDRHRHAYDPATIQFGHWALKASAILIGGVSVLCAFQLLPGQGSVRIRPSEVTAIDGTYQTNVAGGILEMGRAKATFAVDDGIFPSQRMARNVLVEITHPRPSESRPKGVVFQTIKVFRNDPRSSGSYEIGPHGLHIGPSILTFELRDLIQNTQYFIVMEIACPNDEIGSFIWELRAGDFLSVTVNQIQ